MIAPLAVERLVVRDVRCLEAVEMQPGVGLNVLAGDNGQGKTSLLEAVYLVATSRSFRAEKLVEVVREGCEQAVVRASIVEDELRREQRAALGPHVRSVAIDGKRPPSAAAYATRTPVVVFQPGDLALVGGGAALRRTLLDRVALFLDPPSADHRARYTRALRERQRALDERGQGSVDLDAWESLMAEHGSALTRSRHGAAERLRLALLPAFERMAAPGLRLGVTFQPGGSDDVERCREALAADRARDRARKSASFGPHRDDLELSLEGRSARRHASQGQQRVLTLALKSAELECIRQARGAHPILLLDDVSSELDPDRARAVTAFLVETPSQAFVTTPRPDLLPMPPEATGNRTDWMLRGGVLKRL